MYSRHSKFKNRKIAPNSRRKVGSILKFKGIDEDGFKYLFMLIVRIITKQIESSPASSCSINIFYHIAQTFELCGTNENQPLQIFHNTSPATCASSQQKLSNSSQKYQKHPIGDPTQIKHQPSTTPLN